MRDCFQHIWCEGTARGECVVASVHAIHFGIFYSLIIHLVYYGNEDD